jgi:hypothetical protein
MKLSVWEVYSKRAGKGINRLFLAILLEKENKPIIS